MGDRMSRMISLMARVTVMGAMIASCSDQDGANHDKRTPLPKADSYAIITPPAEDCSSLERVDNISASSGDEYFELFKRYEQCERGIDELYYILDKAIDLGSARAMYSKAIMLLIEDPASEEGVELLRAASRNGHDEASRALRDRSIEVTVLRE